MTATLGWASMLQGGALGEEGVKTAIDAIAGSTRAQARLIDDLLDVSRIVAGKLQLSPQPLRLADAVNTAIDTVRSAADAKRIRLVVRTEDPGIRLHGDIARLQQVFWNLLSNAVKFSPRLSEIEVMLTSDDDSARVIVRDNGEGIERELLPFIFDRFRQGDTGATRRHGGLGLGLSIARNLVELHGGTLTAASDGRGQGATFTVTLPLTSGPAEAASREKTDSAPLAGLRLLVVEDDESTRMMLQLALRQFGADVSIASGAADAFDALMRTRFDVVVSDIGMAGEDGCSLMRRLREAGNPVGAIALTAFASETERQRALSAGFQSWLAKPIDPVLLAEEVRRVAR
jgi:CheY-like chemotaxis protein